MGNIKTLQEQLHKRHDDLWQRLTSIEHSRRSARGPLTSFSNASAQDRSTDVVLDRLSQTTRLELIQIIHAMERIQSGQYGECENCFQRISALRLRIVPEVTTCAPCAALQMRGEHGQIDNLFAS